MNTSLSKMSDVTAREQQVAKEYGGQWLSPGMLFFPNSVHVGEVINFATGERWCQMDRIEDAIQNPDGVYCQASTVDGNYLIDEMQVGDNFVLPRPPFS